MASLLTFRLFRTTRSLINQAFEGRDPSSERDLFRLHFLQHGVAENVSEEVRLVLEEQLGSDLSALRSSDDFGSNLKFFFDRDSLVDAEIVQALGETFEIVISDEDAENASSIEDIVLLVNRLLGTRDGA